MLPVIAIVLPCYNEEEILPISVRELLSLLDKMVTDGLTNPSSFILCIDDGSIDSTWTLIKELNHHDPRVKGISLAHNRGHQYALLAGLISVKDKCDAAVSIDADLQDDPAIIPEMVRKFIDGKEIVYAVRNAREYDTWFKRNTAHGFYKFQKIMGVETVYDHADYRLLSSRAIYLLEEYKESNLFLRGIIPMIGLESDIVTFNRKSRLAGKSKYTLQKMFGLAIDGITSFSARPMRLIFFLGLSLLLIDILVAIYVAWSIFFSDSLEAGWASLILSVWFLGSLILMALGMVGEYVGKIFIEVKKRPRFAIRESIL